MVLGVGCLGPLQIARRLEGFARSCVGQRKWQMSDDLLCRRRSHTNSSAYPDVTCVNLWDLLDRTRNSSTARPDTSDQVAL